LKYSKRTKPELIKILLFGIIAGTLSWELTMRLLALAGVSIDLSLGPVGFDLQVIALWIMINPGTFLGIIAALILFHRL